MKSKKGAYLLSIFTRIKELEYLFTKVSENQTKIKVADLSFMNGDLRALNQRIKACLDRNKIFYIKKEV